MDHIAYIVPSAGGWGGIMLTEKGEDKQLTISELGFHISGDQK